jgi:mannose-6-phosphate isomerase-like protein (cupin superfamily)
MIRKGSEMRVEVRNQMRGGTGSVTVQHCFMPEEITAKTRLCARLTLPPGASIGLHAHDREDEVYIITHGSGVLMEDGTEPRSVSAGDAVLTGNGASHAIRNDGAIPLEMIAVIMCYP